MDILRLDVESSGTPAGGVFTAPDSFGGAGYNTDPTATITTSLNSSLSFAVFKVSDFASYTEEALRSFKARVLVDFTVKTSVVSSLTVSAYATPEYDSVLTARSDPTTGNINVAFNKLTDNQGSSLGSLQLNHNTLNGTVDITDAVLKIIDDSESISGLYNGDIVVFFQPSRLGEAVSTNVTNVRLKIFGIIPTADVVSSFGIIVGSQKNIFANVDLGSSSTLPSSGDTIVLPTSNPNAKETLTGDFSTVSQVASRYEIVQSAPAAGTLTGAGLAIDPVVAFQDSSKVGYTFSGTTAQANALIKTLTFTPSSSGGPVSFTLEQYVNAGLPTVLGVSSLYSVADGVSFGGSGQPQSLDILSGAVASNLRTSITAGVSAILNIRNGGQSIGAVVRGGVVNVYDGGVDNAADLSSELSGSLGRDIYSTENVYGGGSAKSTVLREGSQQIVMSGGLATDTQVQNDLDGSTQKVQAGGSAIRTTLFDTGVQIVAGSASATVVKSGGAETVLSGGVADGTSLVEAGASLVLSDGSKVTNLSTVAGSNVTAIGATTVGGITGAGAVAITGGALNLSAASSFAGGVSIAGGALLVAGAPSGVTTLAGVVSGAGRLVKQGAGTLTLTATNTFTGGVSLLAGRLVATTEGALGPIFGGLTLSGGTLETTVDMNISRAISVNAASSWMVDAGATTTLRGNLAGAGSLTKTGAGVLALVGGDTATGGIVIKEGTLAVGSDRVLGPASSILSLAGGALEATTSFTSNRAVTLASSVSDVIQVDAGARLALTGVLGGNGALTKTGVGSLTLSGSNTYSGGTTVSAGLLVVGSDAALGDRHGELVFAGGTLETTKSFSSDRSVKLNAAGTIKVDAGTNLTLTNVVNGSGSLIKAGAGVLTLGPRNDYAGGTTIAAGTLVVSSNASLGASAGAVTFTGGALEATGAVNSARAVHLQAAATLQVDAGATATLSGVLDGTGALTKTGDGVLVLSGANSFSGGLVLKGGVTDLVSAGAAGTGGVVFGDGQTTLTVHGVAGLPNVITGFDTDDTLDLKGVAYASGATATLANGVLTISSGASSETFAHFALAADLAIGQYGLSIGLSSDGAGGTSLVLNGYGRPPLAGSGGNYTGTTPPPVLTALPTATVAENTSAGTTVYTAHAAGGTGALSFGLAGDDAGKFTINPTTGTLSFNAAPDFEQPGAADGSNAYHLNVLVSDSVGARASQAVVLTVTDANDIAPVVISDAAVGVAAGTAAGTTIYTVAATDADTVNGPSSYILGGHDAGLFNLDAATGALSFRGAPVAGQVYEVAVQASDGVNVSAAEVVDITVAAAAPSNVYAPLFTSALTASTAENTSTTVYAATAVDADGDTVSYALSGADAARFAINPVTGEVAFKAAPDFERPGAVDGSNAYSFTVTASDGLVAHRTSQAVTLTVTDLNDTAPVITSGAAVSVVSGTAAGVAVYAATASDVDTTNDTPSYSLGGADAGKFTLDAATGALSFKTAPSYATPDDAGGDHVYDITLTAGDGVNTSAAQAVAITVANPANQAPVFSSGAVATTPEEVSPTTAVYTAHATDVDGDTLVYAIAGGADAAKFAIDAATGAVSFKSPPDFDVPGASDGSNTYQLVVSASDALHAVTQAVAVAVTDVADAALPSNPTESQAEAVINGSAALVKGDVAVTGTLDFTRTDPLTFAGAISGTGSVEKVGGGTLTFSGVNTYTGPTKIDGGLLKVNGSIANSPVTVGAGAELGGSGTTGAVTLGAGASIGPGNSPGTLNTMGDLTLTAGAQYKEEVGGYGAGQFDVINVTGAVKLNNATLNATLYGGFAASAGSSALVIINNDGADAVVGTFAGLAEGATVNVGGQSASISYHGGTGNDVTLTFAAPAVTPVTPPSATTPTQGQLATFGAQFANLLRATPGSSDALNPSNPIYAQYLASTAIAAQFAAGAITQAAAQSALLHLLDGTVSVATLSYAFFTGKTPTSDGLDYLVHSSSNPSDLNDPYYSKFSVENRYINFAAALAKGGTGTAAYHAAYDALSLSDAVTKAYGSIFGVAPVAGKVAQILGEMVPDGLGGQETRAQYFAFYGGDGANGGGAKAAAIGFLLADAIKEGLGPYNAAQQHFLTDLGAGSAAFNVDLVGTYAPSASSGNTMVDAGALH